MKSIFLNLKRFDISPSRGGVNRIAQINEWAKTILESTQAALKTYKDAEFVMFFPEAHLLPAVAAKDADSPVSVGCQGVYRADTAVGGNFGAFTSHLTANAAKEMGCEDALIGHCEERAALNATLAEAGVVNPAAINRILNKEILCAQNAGLRTLYCVGEKSEEQNAWREVLGEQLRVELSGIDTRNITIAYEPIWSIGPGKQPADREYIQKIARFVKETIPGVRVVYGGGLKTDNAKMLASIPEIDGGLIALTRFSGEIGFYPDEYLGIVRLYMEGAQ